MAEDVATTGRAPLVFPDGAVQTVPLEDVERAKAELGAREATDVEYFGAQTGKGGEVTAGLLGAARGATFGLSDKAYVEGARALGDDDTADEARELLRLYKAASPNASFAGELAGAVAPMVATGGAGLAAKGLGTAAKVGIGAAEGAGFGAAAGAGAQLTEDTLENHALVGEAYLSAGLKGGAVGLLLGGAGAGLGQFFGRGRKAAEKAAMGAGREALPVVEREVAQAPGTIGHDAPGFDWTVPPERVGPPPAVPTRTVHEPRWDVSVDPDAGLAAKVGKSESPFETRLGVRQTVWDPAPVSNPTARHLEGRKPFFVDRVEGEMGGSDRVFFDTSGPEYSYPKTPDVFKRELFLKNADAGLTDAVEAGPGPFKFTKGQPVSRVVPADVPGAPLAGPNIDPLRSAHPEWFGMAPSAAEAAAVADVSAPAGRKTILDRVTGLRDDFTYNATGATARDVHKLGANAAEQAAERQRLGQVLREQVDVDAAQGEIDRQLIVKRKETGAALAAMYREADAAVQKPAVDEIRKGMAEIRAKYGGVDPASVPTWAEFNKANMSRLMKEHGGHGPAMTAMGKEYAALRAPTSMFANEQLAAAEKAFSELETVLGKNPTHEKLWEASKAIGDRLKFDHVESVALGKKALRDLYEVTRGELRASVDRASAELGGTIGDRIRSTNALYADLKTLSETTARAARKGPGDTLTRGDAWLGGAAVLSGQPAAVAAVAMNVARRKYGNQVAAHVLNDVVHNTTFRNASAKLDEIIDAGARAFASNSKAAGRASKPVTTAEVRALREATRTPDAVTARITEHLGDMPRVAPKVAQQISLTASRAAAWLQRALPKEAPPATPMFGKPREVPLSDEQLLEARATIETVEDGSIVIDRLRQGRLTEAHVAALRFVHPETFNKIRTYLAQHATELNQTMTQQQLTRLSMLFGEPLSEADLPENVRAFQASFSQGNQAPGRGGAGGNVGMAAMSGGPVKGGGNSATAGDKLEAGGR